jgi:hypothetical protein
MKKLFGGILGAFFFVAVALAQSPLTLLNAGSADTAPPKILTFQVSTSASTTNSITNATAPIGAAAPDRYVIVGLVGEDNLNSTITSITINGTNCPIAIQQNNVRSTAGICILLVTTGTTANIVGTFSGVKDGLFLSVWSATGLLSATPIGTAGQNTNNTATALTTVAGGFAVGACGNYGVGATSTWTGMTFRGGANIGSTRNGAFADTSGIGGSSINVTCNFSSAGTAYSMALASW